MLVLLGFELFQVVPVTYLNAGCLLINKSDFESVGGFNEKYFLYGEEPDLFLKFKLHDFKCVLNPAVEVIHYRDESFNSLPPLEFFKLRVEGLRNILDALIMGYYRLLRKKISAIT